MVPDTRPYRSPSLRVVGIYFLLSLIWIWLSDYVLMRFAEHSTSGFWIAVVKGSLFVSLSSLVVYGLVEFYFARLCRIEDAIHSRERLFRTFVNQATDSFFLHGSTGQLLDVNQQACDSLQYSRNELIGSSTRLFDSTISDEQIAHFRTRLFNEESFTFETIHRRKDGTEFPVEVRCKGFVENGQLYAVSLARDISERRKTEATLRESEHRHRHLINLLPSAIFVEQDDKIVFCNPAFLRLVGADRLDQVLGHSSFDFAPPEFHPLMRSRRAAMYESGEPTPPFQRQALRLNGQRVPVDVIATPIVEQGTPAILVALTDLTEHNRLEEQFRQSQKMEAIGHLAGGIAHDFNNLLTVINGYSEMLLLNSTEPGQQQDALVAIRDAGETAASLVRQLLAFSRRSILEPKILDLNTIVESTGKMLRRLIGEHIQFITHLDSNLHPVRVDPTQIEQLLMNLVVNSKDAMPDGGQLILETHNVDLRAPDLRDYPDLQAGPHVLLTIADTGSGMTDEVKAHIFEPFFTTKEVGKGTGLGLAMVYGIVQMSHGHISVSSSPGKGTTFTILFPAVARPPQPPIDSTRKNFLPLAPRGSETILLVEDDKSVLELAKLVLVQLGYHVLIANSGQAAIELADSFLGPIHLLLTDVVMPEMGGSDVASILQRRRHDLAILFMSGYNDDGPLRQAVEEDANQLLQKPFTPLDLALAVRAVLDGNSLPPR